MKIQIIIWVTKYLTIANWTICHAGCSQRVNDDVGWCTEQTRVWISDWGWLVQWKTPNMNEGFFFFVEARLLKNHKASRDGHDLDCQDFLIKEKFCISPVVYHCIGLQLFPRNLINLTTNLVSALIELGGSLVFCQWRNTEFLFWILLRFGAGPQNFWLPTDG